MIEGNSSMKTRIADFFRRNLFTIGYTIVVMFTCFRTGEHSLHVLLCTVAYLTGIAAISVYERFRVLA